MATSGKLQGIFTPNIVPLDARGEINEAELRRYTDWLIDGGVHGLYPNGSTGEFTRFTDRRAATHHRHHGRPDTRPRADSGGSCRSQHPRDDSGLRILQLAGSPGRGHRVAVLLQAQPQRRLQLLQRDRPQHAGRRDAVQHSAVRLADRRADDCPPGRRMSAHRGDQGFVGRSAEHDADDPSRATEPARIHIS